MLSPTPIGSVLYLGPRVKRHDVRALQRFGCKPEPTSEWSSNNRYDLLLHTPKGVVEFSIGWWVVKYSNGEFYPCKPNIVPCVVGDIPETRE